MSKQRAEYNELLNDFNFKDDSGNFGSLHSAKKTPCVTNVIEKKDLYGCPGTVLELEFPIKRS